MNKKVTGFLLASLILSQASLGVVNADSQRIAGANRYETALKISAKTYKSADTVIVVTGENFPDSLTASALSGLYDAPILLSTKSKVNEVSKEIKRLGAKDIIIIGGQVAVSKEEENAYKSLGKVRRIEGKNRYETANKIAKEIIDQNGADSCFVASGENYPDALAIGPVANKNVTPVILASGDDLPEATESLKTIKEATIVGGPVAVGSVEKNFTSSNRIQGSNRYETSTKVADKYFKGVSKAALASGENYPDALALAPYAEKQNMPILLSPAKGKNATVEKYIKDNKITSLEIFGGEKAIESVYETTAKPAEGENNNSKPKPNYKDETNNSKPKPPVDEEVKTDQVLKHETIKTYKGDLPIKATRVKKEGKDGYEKYVDGELVEKVEPIDEIVECLVVTQEAKYEEREVEDKTKPIYEETKYWRAYAKGLPKKFWNIMSEEELSEYHDSYSVVYASGINQNTEKWKKAKEKLDELYKKYGIYKEFEVKSNSDGSNKDDAFIMAYDYVRENLETLKSEWKRLEPRVEKGEKIIGYEKKTEKVKVQDEVTEWK
ncbi:MAG: cell wall-binding repeat-containing protein [Finegoldia sp.]|nr:cell wall-binding repeat-containing protein [Finegoldia sp.]